MCQLYMEIKPLSLLKHLVAFDFVSDKFEIVMAIKCFLPICVVIGTVSKLFIFVNRYVLAKLVNNPLKLNNGIN